MIAEARAAAEPQLPNPQIDRQFYVGSIRDILLSANCGTPSEMALCALCVAEQAQAERFGDWHSPEPDPPKHVLEELVHNRLFIDTMRVLALRWLIDERTAGQSVDGRNHKKQIPTETLIRSYSDSKNWMVDSLDSHLELHKHTDFNQYKSRVIKEQLQAIAYKAEETVFAHQHRRARRSIIQKSSLSGVYAERKVLHAMKKIGYKSSFLADPFTDVHRGYDLVAPVWVNSFVTVNVPVQVKSNISIPKTKFTLEESGIVRIEVINDPSGDSFYFSTDELEEAQRFMQSLALRLGENERDFIAV